MVHGYYSWMASWRFEDDENSHYPTNHIATHNQISNKHFALDEMLCFPYTTRLWPIEEDYH